MPQLSFMAAGYLCVAVNIHINGFGFVLPTSVGYITLAVAAWQLRLFHKVYAYAAIPAGVLAAVTLPDMIAAVIGESMGVIMHYRFWPALLLQWTLMGMLGCGLWREADVKARDGLKWGVYAIAPVALGAFVAWWMVAEAQSLSSGNIVMIYYIPAFYLAALHTAAAKVLV